MDLCDFPHFTMAKETYPKIADPIQPMSKSHPGAMPWGYKRSSKSREYEKSSRVNVKWISPIL